MAPSDLDSMDALGDLESPLLDLSALSLAAVRALGDTVLGRALRHAQERAGDGEIVAGFNSAI